SQGACLAPTLLLGLLVHAHMQHLDRRRHLQIAMLCQIDLGEGSPPKHALQVIMTKLLSDTVTHTCILSMRQSVPTHAPCHTKPMRRCCFHVYHNTCRAPLERRRDAEARICVHWNCPVFVCLMP